MRIRNSRPFGFSLGRPPYPGTVDFVTKRDKRLLNTLSKTLYAILFFFNFHDGTFRLGARFGSTGDAMIMFTAILRFSTLLTGLKSYFRLRFYVNHNNLYIYISMYTYNTAIVRTSDDLR